MPKLAYVSEGSQFASAEASNATVASAPPPSIGESPLLDEHAAVECHEEEEQEEGRDLPTPREVGHAAVSSTQCAVPSSALSCGPRAVYVLWPQPDP